MIATLVVCLVVTGMMMPAYWLADLKLCYNIGIAYWYYPIKERYSL